MSAPEICVVLVSWNTADCIGTAIDSVPVGCGDRSYEVVVVDNGSEDGSVEMLRTRKDVTLVELGANTGFTHAANVGAEKALGEFVLFLNPDVTLTPGCVKLLADTLDEHDEAWAATGWFVYPDGSPQGFWRRPPQAWMTFLCFTRLGKRVDRTLGSPMRKFRNSEDLPNPPGIIPIRAAGAACLLVRREEFETAGRFDERYLNFFQDGEIQRKKRREGRVFLGVGPATIIHSQGVTLKKMPDHEVEGQLLYGLRQYLQGAPFFSRVGGELAIRVDLLLRRNHRRELREAVLRPLV